MRTPWLAVVVISASCSAPTEVLVEVDGDPSLTPLLTTLRVDLRADGADLDGFDVPLDPTTTSCLPFSFSVLIENRTVGDPLTVAITASPTLGAPIVHTTDLVVEDGLRLLEIELPGPCVDDTMDCTKTITPQSLPVIERVAAQRRVDRNTCGIPVDAVSCVEAGGCYADERSGRCVVPCPEPVDPVPPEDPAGPNPVTEPTLSPCPTGWTGPACTPWPPGGHVRPCASGEAHLPGRGGCEPIGTACPAGRFSTALPPGTAVYVDPTAMGGDGSMQSPLTTIAEALSTNAEVIVLARATHAGAVGITRPVTFVGACAAETVVGDVDVSAAVDLRDLRAGSLSASSDVRLDGVVVGDMSVSGASVDATETVFSGDVLLDGGTTTAVRSAFVASGAFDVMDARLDLTDCVVHGPNELALLGTTTASITTSAVEVTPVRFAGGSAAGMSRSVVRGAILGEERATIWIARSVVEDTTDPAIRVSNDSSLLLTDVVVRDVAETNEFGRGLVVEASAFARGERIVFESTHGTAVDARGRVEFTDVSIAETNGTPRGVGLRIYVDATIERAAFDQHASAAIVLEPSARASLMDVEIGGAVDRTGTGIEIEPGATATIARARITGTRVAGIRMQTNGSAASNVTVDDLHVVATRPGGSARSGIGLVVGDGYRDIDSHRPATLTLRRARFEQNVGAGLGVARCDATVTDLFVSETLPAVSNDIRLGGFGVVVTNGATLDAERIALIGNDDAAIYVGILSQRVGMLPSRATIREALLADTACADCTALLGSGGGVSQTGTLKVRRFRAENNAYAGFYQRFVGGGFDLFEGVIVGHQFGVDVRAAGFEPERLVRRVRFEDNITDLRLAQD